MNINVHHYHHISADGEVLKRLDLIISQNEKIMNKQERLDLAIANLNEGTNEIATDLQKLKDEIAAGNVSEESLAALETNIQVLKELGNQQ